MVTTQKELKNEQTQTHPHHHRPIILKRAIKRSAKVYEGTF